MSSSPEAVVHFYNRRGTCEQDIKEGKHALTWTRLSCSRFSSNRVRLALFVLAYNLGNFMRRFALPKEVSHWSLTSIQLKLIKIGAKIISHSRMTGLIKDGRPTMLGVRKSRAEGRRPMRKLHVGILCHETVWEMRVGPSEPACRDRLQTTVSGVSKELGSLASRKRQTRDSVR